MTLFPAGIVGHPLKGFTDEEVRLVAGVAPGVIETNIDVTFPVKFKQWGAANLV